jgi:hypothetical protein
MYNMINFANQALSQKTALQLLNWRQPWNKGENDYKAQLCSQAHMSSVPCINLNGVC